MKIAEVISSPFTKFSEGDKVKIKRTGEIVTVTSQNEIGLVQTVSNDAVPLKKKGGFFKGFKEYMPKELELIK